MAKPPFDLKPLARALHNGHSFNLESSARRVDHTDATPAKGERVFDFNATPQEYEYVRRCMQRMRDTLRDHIGKGAERFDEHTAAMDIIAVHRNCMPLDLFQLLTSSDDDFTHDVFGIGMFWDRQAGVLKNGFKPRCRKVMS